MPPAPPLPPSHPANRQRPKSPNRVLAESEAQWLFTPAELSNTPSIQDGMTLLEERDIRSKGINFILQVGIMLKLPQLTLSTAATFFQRFLMRSSLKKARGDVPKLHHYQSAATSLFLATKVEESCRKMKEMIVAFCRVAQKNPNLVVDEQSKDYWRWRDCLLHNEDVLLETLCFDLTVESPHRQLFEMLKYYGVEHNKRLRNAAWAFVTDSNNTQLCLLVNSRTVAVAGLYAACRYSEVALPDDQKGRAWWEAQGVRLKDVRKAVEHMCANYETVAGKDGTTNGDGDVSGRLAQAGVGEDGKSMYVGLATPLPAAGSGDGWDSTRLREDPGKASPLPTASERRVSNDEPSAVGTKREREEDSNGVSHPVSNINGANAPNKRPRLGEGAVEETVQGGDVIFGGGDPAKREEEAKRVEHGNTLAEADVRAADGSAVAANGHAGIPETAGVDEEGSEEGEVEE